MIALMDGLQDIDPEKTSLVRLTDRDGKWIIANDIMRHFVPKQIPSRNPERTKRWRGFDVKGNPLDPSQWPSARALRGETVSPGVDFIYTNDDGKEQWVRIASAPFRDANGTVVGATTVIEDIREQKRLAEIEKLLFSRIAASHQQLTRRHTGDCAEEPRRGQID